MTIRRTRKSIMIHGVDVSGCKLLNKVTRSCKYSKEGCNALCNYGAEYREIIIKNYSKLLNESIIKLDSVGNFIDAIIIQTAKNCNMTSNKNKKCLKELIKHCNFVSKDIKKGLKSIAKEYERLHDAGKIFV